MKNWLNVSVTRLISSLSFVLLSFLFIVILYSVYTLQKISQEMREVAEVDIPLEEIIADVEMLQLRQHLTMENIRQQGDQLFSNDNIKATAISELYEYNEALTILLDKAMTTVQSSLKLDRVRIRMQDHQKVLAQIRALHVHRDQFNTLTKRFFEQVDPSISIHWEALEKQDNQLDLQTNELLRSIDDITVKVSAHAENQERQFFIVNTILGISALSLGIDLTFLAIRSFRRRVDSVRGQIESLHLSLNTNSPNRRGKFDHVDELSELENDLKVLMGQFSQEMSDRHEVESKLIELATRDKLTGLYNRHKWDDQLKSALELARRGNVFSLILMDVDDFKNINDSYGHDIGDKVLQCLGREVQKLLSSSDLLFRIGGEEFAVLLKNTREEGAENLAESLRVKIENLKVAQLPKLTMSFGVTSYQLEDDQDTIVKRADMLLYEAKDAGKNQIKVG